MAGFVTFVGWLAFVAGLAFIGLPFAMPGWSDWLSMATSVSLGVFALLAGTLLTGVAHLIGIAAKIAENTSWFSAGVPAGAKQPKEAASQPEPVPAEPPEATESTQGQTAETPQPATTGEPEPAPPGEDRSSGTPVSVLYDAARHPPAVEEWTHRGRRVMTLEDGTFATEIGGAWRRFVRLEDIDAAGQQ